MEPNERDAAHPERRGPADGSGRSGADRAAYDERVGDDRTRAQPVVNQPPVTQPPVRDERERAAEDRAYGEAAAREKFGGANLGAGFFGWLVAIGMAALLTGILAVIATAVGYANTITISDAQRAAGTISLVTGIVLLVVLLVAYYSGGYVAGRMSRFDGGRQGLVVWLIGLVVTIAAAVLGFVAGDQYNLLDRVNVPRIPFPTDQVTTAGLVTVVVVVLGTLLAAMAGGKVGRRYHSRVDRAAL